MFEERELAESTGSNGNVEKTEEKYLPYISQLATEHGRL